LPDSERKIDSTRINLLEGELGFAHSFEELLVDLFQTLAPQRLFYLLAGGGC
jgi:hypothetical protein